MVEGVRDRRRHFTFIVRDGVGRVCLQHYESNPFLHLFSAIARRVSTGRIWTSTPGERLPTLLPTTSPSRENPPSPPLSFHVSSLSLRSLLSQRSGSPRLRGKRDCGQGTLRLLVFGMGCW